MTAPLAWPAVAQAGVTDMTDYQVTLEFRQPPAFSLVIQANSEAEAKSTARRLAPEYGFPAAPKKIIVRHYELETT